MTLRPPRRTAATAFSSVLSPSINSTNHSIISNDTSGLPEDIEVRIFNGDFKEGYVKYRSADLDFTDINECLTMLDGTLDFNVKYQRCEFDCP